MELLEYMINTRRHLHKHPELSSEEFDTNTFVAKQLIEMGCKPTTCALTGVYADHISDKGLPWILFRADMDALAMEEKNSFEYCSEKKGVMHSCGHDVHMAMLLGTARKLVGEKLPYNIRFVFQPSEEIAGGAARMIAEGVIPPRTKAIFAFHVWPEVSSSKIGLKSGTIMASNDYFSITFEGTASHCAMRHNGRDAMAAGANMLNALDLIGKSVPANEPALVFCGKFNAGSGYNIVASNCTLEGTIRTTSDETRTKIESLLKEKAESIASVHGVSADVVYKRQYPVLQNDSNLIEKLHSLLDNVEPIKSASMTAEDFAFFSEKVPSVMMFLGSGKTSPLHSDRFDVDENIMAIGCDAFCNIARNVVF